MKDFFQIFKDKLGDVLFELISDAETRRAGSELHVNDVKMAARRRDIAKRREERKAESRKKAEQRRKDDRDAGRVKSLGELPKPVAVQDNLFVHPALELKDLPKPVVVEEPVRRIILEPGKGLSAFGKNVNVVINGIMESTSSNMVPTNQYDIVYVRQGIVVGYATGTTGSPPSNTCSAIGEVSTPGDLITVNLTYGTAIL